MGPGGFLFPTNQDLADIFGRTDLNSGNFYCSDFLDSRLPYFQTQGCQPEIAGARLCNTSATAPRWLRTTKLVRSKELGQYHENPVSANPVWGIFTQDISMVVLEFSWLFLGSLFLQSSCINNFLSCPMMECGTNITILLSSCEPTTCSCC